MPACSLQRCPCSATQQRATQQCQQSAKAHRTRAAMHAIAHTMTRTSDSAAHPSSPDQPTAAVSNRSHVHARPPRLSVYVCVLVHAPGKQEKTELDSRLLITLPLFIYSKALYDLVSFFQPASLSPKHHYTCSTDVCMCPIFIIPVLFISALLITPSDAFVRPRPRIIARPLHHAFVTHRVLSASPDSAPALPEKP